MSNERAIDDASHVIAGALNNVAQALNCVAAAIRDKNREGTQQELENKRWTASSENNRPEEPKRTG